MKKLFTLTLIALATINGKALCAEYEKLSETTAKRVYTVRREEVLSIDRLNQQKAALQSRIDQIDAQILALQQAGVKSEAALREE